MIFKRYRELVIKDAADAWFGVTPEAVTAARAKLEKDKAEAARRAEAERLAKVVPMPKMAAAKAAPHHPRQALPMDRD